MMSDGKRKKSGASSRKLKKARVEEESKLGAFMKNYLTARSALTVSIDSNLVVADVQVMPAQSPYDNIPVPSDNDFKTSSSELFYLFSQKIRFSIQLHQW